MRVVVCYSYDFLIIEEWNSGLRREGNRASFEWYATHPDQSRHSDCQTLSLSISHGSDACLTAVTSFDG